MTHHTTPSPPEIEKKTRFVLAGRRQGFKSWSAIEVTNSASEWLTRRGLELSKYAIWEEILIWDRKERIVVWRPDH